MTVLITGGAYQGKKSLAYKLFGLSETDFVDGKTCSEFKQAKGIYNLQEYLRIHTQVDLQDFIGKVIICNEIGCGVIPMDSSLDDWRERTGRICCKLAEQADLVLSVTAGIPIVLKGTLESEETI